MTSSPGPRPQARAASSRASVQEVVSSALRKPYRPSKKAWQRFVNSKLPAVRPLSNTCWMNSSSRPVKWGRLKGIIVAPEG